MNDFNINIRVMGQATGDLLSAASGKGAASGKVKAGTESSSSGLGAHLVAMQKQQSKEGIAVLKSESKATKFQQRELLNSLLTAEKEAERWQRKDSEIMWKSIGKMDDDFRKTGVKQNNSLTKILGATLGMHVALNEFLKQLQSFFRILLLPMRLLGAFALMMLAKMGVLKGAADYAKGVGDLLFNDKNADGTVKGDLQRLFEIIFGVALAVLPAIVAGVASTILYQQVVGFFATVAGGLTDTAVVGSSGAIAVGAASLAASVGLFFVAIAGALLAIKAADYVGEFILGLFGRESSNATRAKVQAQYKRELEMQKGGAIAMDVNGNPVYDNGLPKLPGWSNTLDVFRNGGGTVDGSVTSTFAQGLNLGASALSQFTEATMAATGAVWRNSKGEIVNQPVSTADAPGSTNYGTGLQYDTQLGKWFASTDTLKANGEAPPGYEGVYRPGSFVQSAAGAMVEGYLSKSAMMEANDAQLRAAAMAILQFTAPNANAYGDQDSFAVLISRIEQVLYSAQNAQAVVNIYGVTDSNLIDKINQYFQTSLRGRSSYGVQG